MTLLAMFLALLTVSGAAPAQVGGDPEMHRKAMEKLGFLVGEWDGDG